MRRMMPLGLRSNVFLTLFTLLILLPGRISLPPLDRDESRYLEASPARCSRPATWCEIRFQDRPRSLQPAGIYWLESGATVAVVDARSPARPRRSNQAWPYRIPVPRLPAPPTSC